MDIIIKKFSHMQTCRGKVLKAILPVPSEKALMLSIFVCISSRGKYQSVKAPDVYQLVANLLCCLGSVPFIKAWQLLRL